MFPRTGLVALAFVFAAYSAHAAAPDLSGKDPHWIQDAANLCWAADPDPKPGETIVWNGECEGGLINGKGTLSWYIKGRLVGRDQGTFKAGELFGHGRVSQANGVTYDGDFPGKGFLITPDGHKIAAQAIREGAGYSIEQVAPEDGK